MKYFLLLLAVTAAVAAGGLWYLGHASGSGTAPGLVEGRLSACPTSPNCVISEDGASLEQHVVSLPANAWSRIPSAVQSLGGTITAQTGQYLSAEFVSSTFKFTDDVEFRRTADGVHVRSASRVGYSDLGANRARVEALRARLDSN
ncbi:MAG: DUF1499 domain-containing protein [Pseudomonadota bacterium]